MGNRAGHSRRDDGRRTLATATALQLTLPFARLPAPSTPPVTPAPQCEECVNDWKKGKWHVDLWMGPTSVSLGPELIACENAMTLSKATIEVDPPSTYAVITTPLYNNVTRSCIVPAPPCEDQGNECGNECDALPAGTCAQIEAILLLNDTRFRQLNPTVDCSKPIPAGANLCMGGTCGD